VSSAARVLRILECLADHDQGLTQAQITTAAGLPRSTIQYLLSDLRELDFIELGDRRRYSPGPAAWALIASMERRNGLLAALKPVLERVSASTGETSILSVAHARLDGYPETIHIVDWASGTHAVQLIPTLGPQPLGTDAASQVFLAFDDPERPGTRAADLNQVRARGWAIHRETSEVNLTSIAAPVFDALGHVAAAVTVAGPSTRMRDVQSTIWPALSAALRSVDDV
jgi:IclR family transcriptional regulator, pca regulon regulatory protein